MTPPTETLHDLSRRRRLPVEIAANPVLDLALALWSATGGDDKAASHELGKQWFSRFLSAVPAEVRERMAVFGGDRGYPWILVVGMIATHGPATADPEEIFGWLETADLADPRELALREHCWKADEEDLAAAADGDPDAIAACLETVPPAKRAGIERFFRVPPAELGSELAAVLRAVRESAFAPHEAAWAGSIARSAHATRPLGGSMEPQALIERVSNGISYDIPFGITRLVLAPSVTIRPWTLVTELGETLVIVYPVADEHLDADPDAPPRWLVSFYKALGDERRLRMLRRIGEGEVGLAELTDLVGLAKSTVFHHLGVLRSAGLVRVRLSGDAGPTYTLRTDVFDDAATLLDDYLRPLDRAPERGSNP